MPTDEGQKAEDVAKRVELGLDPRAPECELHHADDKKYISFIKQKTGSGQRIYGYLERRFSYLWQEREGRGRERKGKKWKDDGREKGLYFAHIFTEMMKATQ